MGQLPDGTPCLKSPEWDVLPDCEAKIAEYNAAAGECGGSLQAAFRPGCQDKLNALLQSFDWGYTPAHGGPTICQEIGLLKMMAQGDPTAAAQMDAALAQLYAMPSCDGKTRPAPKEEVVEEEKDEKAVYVTVAIAAVAVGALGVIGYALWSKQA